jgi:hypothetical protein
MVEIDPGLDARLGAFFDHYGAEAMPSRLATFDQSAKPKRRSAVQLFAGAISVAVIAAGIAVLTIELRSHDNPAPSPAGTSSGVRSSLPSAAQMTAPLPSSSRTVIPVSRGRGAATLQSFTPDGVLFIEYACVGEGTFAVELTNSDVASYVASNVVACSPDGTAASVQGVIVPAIAPIGGRPLTLKVSADPTTNWEVVVADGGPVLPGLTLDFSGAPAGALALVEGMYGTGTTSVGPFTPTGPLYVRYACAGTGTINFAASNSFEQINTRGGCMNGAVGTALLSVQSLKGPVELSVGAAPKGLWEILVYELPGPKS